MLSAYYIFKMSLQHMNGPQVKFFKIFWWKLFLSGMNVKLTDIENKSTKIKLTGVLMQKTCLVRHALMKRIQNILLIIAHAT